MRAEVEVDSSPSSVRDLETAVQEVGMGDHFSGWPGVGG